MDDVRRKALVIGASSPGGLGEATARRLAMDGADVIVAGRRIEPLERLADTIGGRAIACDLGVEDSIAALVADSGPVDVLVNAAGTTMARSIVKLTREAIEEQFAIHVTANLLLLKHAAPVLPTGASIILFSSLTARLAGAGLADRKSVV